MFILFSITFYCLFTSAVTHQNYGIITINKSYINEKDNSNYSDNYQRRLLFYKEDNDLFFMNEVINNYCRSFSLGKVSEIKTRKITDLEMDCNIIQFKWTWENSYDDKTGMADVYIHTLNQPSKVACRVVIITEKIDILDYRGVLSNSLESFLQYFSNQQEQRNNNKKKKSATKLNNNTPLLKKTK